MALIWGSLLMSSAVTTVTALRGSRNSFFWDFTGDINQTALQEFEAWDLEQGWRAKQRPGVDYSDLSAWPAVDPPAEKGWDTGLVNPRVVVLSMRQRSARRHSFKQQFEGVGWNLGLSWAAALEGAGMPSRLRWLKGHEDPESWDADKPGNWGCYISHLAILREHQAKCADCDLVVFEDDAVFVPKFQKRWDAFFATVPKDWSVARLGAQSLWEPSFEVTPDYVRAKAVSNTWGYVVRAEAVPRLADLLAGLPVKGAWGVDAVMQLFTDELKTYVPTVPLVQAVGSCSDSSAKDPGHGCEQDGEADLQRRIVNLAANWPQGYARTYCAGKGVLRTGHDGAAKIGCAAGLEIETCCPYSEPPTLSM